MGYATMPRGSILSIEAKDLLATPAGNTVKWNKITEHNRSQFDIATERIESKNRTSNGTLRKFWVADKKIFTVSWDMLPSYRTLTVDGGWGAEDIRSFFASPEGKLPFNIKINLAKNGTDQTESASDYEIYSVSFSQASFTIQKRGIQPHWNVQIILEEI